MSSRSTHPRLVAIVFTDVVDFSALVHRSPELGKRLLDRQRQVIREFLSAYGGREIETAGDSFLLEFDGAYAALACMAAVQRELNSAGAGLPAGEQVRIRVGIHIGDVEHRGAEIFGDGVNVAARILALSPPGGIAFSADVHHHVHNRMRVAAASIGIHNLKNIATPLELFTLEPAALEAALVMEEPAPAPRSNPRSDPSRGSAPQAGGSVRLWCFADACFDDGSLQLSVSGKVVELERKPLEVLRYLLWHANEVVTKDELLDSVWPGRILSESILKKAVSRVRAVLKDESEEIIKTVRGYGYRLVAPVSVELRGSGPPARIACQAGETVPLRHNWRLVRRLGSGGQGEAWLAVHEKSGEQRVYKFATAEAGVAALKREITLYRLLRQSLGERADLVRILDWNLEQEPLFTEAEYVAGGNLLEWAAAQGGLDRVPLQQRLELAAQIADVLGAAHALAILHRDLKPGNIFVVPGAGGQPRAKLADFGSATLLDSERLEQYGITRIGLVGPALDDSAGGTMLYAAPECLAGQPATVQADIYALGIVLYQLAKGDLRRPLAPGWEAEIEDELLREDIAAAAHLNPQQRLTDAASLARRLRTLDQRRAQRQAERAAAAAAERTRRDLVRMRARRNSLLAVLAAVAAGAVLSLVLYVQARSAWAEADRRAAEAESASQFLLHDLLSGIDPAQHDVKVLAGAKQLLDAGSRKIDKRFAKQPVLAAQVRHRFIRAYLSLGFVGEGISLGSQLREQAQDALRRGNPEALTLGLMLAEDAPNIGAREQDAPYWTALRALAAQQLDRHDMRLARVDFVIALLQAERGDYAAALAAFNDLQGRLAVAKDADERLGLEVTGAIAGAQADLGDLAGAEASLRQAIDRGSGIFGASSGAVLAQRARLTRLLSDRGRYLEAAQESEDALAIARRTRGPGNAVVIELELAQAMPLAEQGRFAEALALMQPAVDQFAAGSPEDDEVLLAFQSTLAQVQLWAGQLDAASQRLRRIVELRQRMAAADSIPLAQTRLLLVEALLAQGRPDEAQQQFAVIPQAALQRLAGGAVSAAELERVQGLLALATGHREQGVAQIDAAVGRLRTLYGSGHWWLEHTANRLDAAPR